MLSKSITFSQVRTGRPFLFLTSMWSYSVHQMGSMYVFWAAYISHSRNLSWDRQKGTRKENPSQPHLSVQHVNIGPSMPFHRALSRSLKFCLLPSLLPDGRSMLRKYLAQTYRSFSFRGYHGKEALWTGKGWNKLMSGLRSHSGL